MLNIVSTVKKNVVTSFHKNGFSVDIFQFFLGIKESVYIQTNLKTNLFGFKLFILLDIHLSGRLIRQNWQKMIMALYLREQIMNG